MRGGIQQACPADLCAFSFVEEGVQREQAFVSGRYYDVVLMSCGTTSMATDQAVHTVERVAYLFLLRI